MADQYSDEVKLEVADRYSWYIINALMTKVRDLSKAITEAEAVLKAKPNDDHNAAYNGLENMLDYCRQSLKEHEEALNALKTAGFK